MLNFVINALIVLVIYNIPSIIAVLRFHNNAFRIVTMNIALGWTVIGWCWALKWALQSPTAEYGNNWTPSK